MLPTIYYYHVGVQDSWCCMSIIAHPIFPPPFPQSSWFMKDTSHHYFHLITELGPEPDARDLLIYDCLRTLQNNPNHFFHRLALVR